MLVLGAVPRLVATVLSMAAYAWFHYSLGWAIWLSVACAVCVFGLASIGMFLAVSALEVRALKKRGLPLID